MIENSNPVEAYLETFRNERTRLQHKSHLNQFFNLVKVKKPETYFASNRDYTADVTNLWNSTAFLTG